MPLNELLQEKREGILRIASQWGASNMRVFESVARNEANSKSDIDLLVDKEKRTIRKETIYEEHACS